MEKSNEAENACSGVEGAKTTAPVPLCEAF